MLADWSHFALSRKAQRRFNALLDAPLESPEALWRLLSTPAPWEC